MKRLLILLLVLVAWPAASEAASKHVYRDVRYVSGHAGFASSLSGRLVLTASELGFEGSGGRAFAIPLGTIVGVAVSEPSKNAGASPALTTFYIQTRAGAVSETLLFEARAKTARTLADKLRSRIRTTSGRSAVVPPELYPVDPIGVDTASLR